MTTEATRQTSPIVLDTNIVLDLLVFNDPAAEPNRQALKAGTLNWLATQPMRDELSRVLTYPKIATRLAFYKLSVEDVLAQFDLHVCLVAVAPKAGITCSDADDQKFIDLAEQHNALLLSKDKHIMSMRKRLLARGIRAQTEISSAAILATI